MFSSVTGTKISISELSLPDYWVTNMVSKVKFSDALIHLTSYVLEDRERTLGSRSGRDLLIEIGPHSALQRQVKDTISELGKTDHVGYDSILERNVSALRSCLSLMGRLRCNGSMVDLVTINSPKTSEAAFQMLTDLPEYPFNHSQTFWQESRISKNFRFRNFARHELLGTPSADWNPLEHKWRNIIKRSDNPWIEDHKGSSSHGVHILGTN